MAEAGYNREQLASMQQDAIRRVEEMQRRAQEKLKQTGTNPSAQAGSQQDGNAPPRQRNRGGLPARGRKPQRQQPYPANPVPLAERQEQLHKEDTEVPQEERLDETLHEAVEETNEIQEGQPESETVAGEPPPDEHIPPPLPESTGRKPHAFNPLSIIENMEKDTMLILLMLFVLLREGSDYKLLLALCYILI